MAKGKAPSAGRTAHCSTAGMAHPRGCGVVLCPHRVPLPVDTGPGSPSHGRSLPATQLLNGGSAHTQHRCFISSQPHADRGAGSWQQLAEAALQLWLSTGEVRAGSASPCEPSSQRHSPQKEKPRPNLLSCATKRTPSQGKGCCEHRASLPRQERPNPQRSSGSCGDEEEAGSAPAPRAISRHLTAPTHRSLCLEPPRPLQHSSGGGSEARSLRGTTMGSDTQHEPTHSKPRARLRAGNDADPGNGEQVAAQPGFGCRRRL